MSERAGDGQSDRHGIGTREKVEQTDEITKNCFQGSLMQQRMKERTGWQEC